MDNPGWHASRRAHKEHELHLRRYRESVANHSRLPPQVGDLAPLEESQIGGFEKPPMSPPTCGPAVPPKHVSSGMPVPQHSRLPSSQTKFTTAQLLNMTASQRSKFFRAARMEPHLQFMCGPLLKYDTVDENGIWHGAALIVTVAADSGSIYDPHPTLTYSWGHYPDLSASRSHSRTPSSVSWKPSLSQGSYELGPHPADPHSISVPASPSVSAFGAPNYTFSSAGLSQSNGNVSADSGYDMPKYSDNAYGQELWVYCGTGGTSTFWRFLIHVPLAKDEMAVRYSINNGQQLEFWIPGRDQDMRWASYSCNGFSSGVNQDDFRGPGFKSGFDPLWMDLLSKHAEKPFHCLVGGGDQLYCDSILREPELQDWVSTVKPEQKKQFPLSQEMEHAIDRFYFNFYCQSFRTGAFARANCSIPMLNMCDDHDLIDGFGSYPEDLQMSPVFRHIGARGYFYFLLFQCFINVDIDGIQPNSHVYKSIIIGEPGPYVRSPSHSFLTRLGPEVYMLLLDCRAERRKEQICSLGQYNRVFNRLNSLPTGVQHIVLQLGVPIAYPRMVFLETALESKTLASLSKSGLFSSLVNKFNADPELLDDLNDHWTATHHKKERNWLVEQLQNFARIKRVRVSFISGDVHCASAGYFQTLKTKGKPDVLPINDYRYMVNVVSSAIVNRPSPHGVVSMTASLATKTHRTLHHINTDENMIPIFTTEPDGQSTKQKFIMGRRNWCQTEVDTQSGELVFDIRVEKKQGYGVTVGYPVRVPPPKW